jgi:hypothetical protein
MEIAGENVRLLMRLGYWALWRGLYAEASAIFAGAHAARPASEVPIIAHAVLAMAMNEPKAAVTVLRGLAREGQPLSEMAETHLGCALCLAGEEDAGRQILQRISAQGREETTRRMASTLAGMPTSQLAPGLAKVL